MNGPKVLWLKSRRTQRLAWPTSSKCSLRRGADFKEGWADTINSVKNGAVIFNEMWDQLTSSFREGWEDAIDCTAAGSANVIGLFSNMETQVDDKTEAMVAGFRRRAKEIEDEAQKLRDSLVGHSIWTGMWDEMVDVADSRMSKIRGKIGGDLGTIQGNFTGFAGGVGGAARPSTITVNQTINIQGGAGTVQDAHTTGRIVSDYLALALRGRR